MAPTTTKPPSSAPGGLFHSLRLRLVAIGLLLVGVTVAFSRYFGWSDAMALFESLQDNAADHLVATILIYAGLQTVGMIFSLPTKGILTVIGGALIGTWLGSAVTALSVTGGTCVLFLGVRHLFKHQLERRIPPRIEKILQRISKRPARFIAGLRMIITLPYGPITIAAALTPMRFRDFLLGTLLGDLPIIVLYSAAGSRISQLTGPDDVLSWPTGAILIGAGALFAFSALLSSKQATTEEIR